MQTPYEVLIRKSLSEENGLLYCLMYSALA